MKFIKKFENIEDTKVIDNITEELLSKYLDFVEDEYYYYSGQWYKKGEDEYSEKTQILKEFIKTL